MKIIFAILALLSPVLCAVSAEVKGVNIEVRLDQEQFLAGEDIPVAVRIDNLSGQTLHLGKDADWLTFEVFGDQNPLVIKLGDPPVEGEFAVNSGFIATKRVNLAPYFKLDRAGHYDIKARVRIPDWGAKVENKKAKGFEIVRGNTLREFEFGVPLGTNSPATTAPETRKYVLQQANYKKQLTLYLRLTDSTGSKIFRVFPIAQMLSFGNPEFQIDRYSHLHVLSQVGARAFNYSVINPDGDIILRQIHEIAGSKPLLKADNDGMIFVSGGLRRPNPTDIPAETAASKETDVAKSKQ
jgi:hypothetical protein